MLTKEELRHILTRRRYLFTKGLADPSNVEYDLDENEVYKNLMPIPSQIDEQARAHLVKDHWVATHINGTLRKQQEKALLACRARTTCTSR